MVPYFMYRSDTRSMPSGFAGVQSMMTSFRNRFVSSSLQRDHLIDHLEQLLRAEHFARVQAAVDPDDRLAFLRERLRLRVGQALRRCESCDEMLL